jgi:NAD(P)-dependent dehydrogenase (short-subunit alcohol dehydrogenase family)
MENDSIPAGKTAAVTGASSGIGLHSLIALVRAGAFGIGIGRDSQRCARAQELVEAACPGGQVRYLVADLSRQSEVRRLAVEIEALLDKTGFPALDVLVNNAGIYAARRTYTEDGVELMLAVNHLAAFVLTHLLLPRLRAAPAGRIITISSASHYRAIVDFHHLNKPLIYFGYERYKIHKFANVLFTYELNRRLAGTNVRAFAVDPGLINTDMGLKGTGALASLFWMFRRRNGRSPEVPARTVLFLSSEPSLQESRDFYWRDCRPKQPDPRTARADLAQQLWQISVQLCKLDNQD